MRVGPWHDSTGALVRDTNPLFISLSPLSPHKDTEKCGHYKPKEGASERELLCQNPDLGYPAPSTVRRAVFR